MLKRVVTRRLPGFRFEAESPPLAEWLPRMDVACFVGFAASGPLDVPVAVESAAHFEAIYGTARVGVQIVEPADNWLRLFVSWVADEQGTAAEGEQSQ